MNWRWEWAESPLLPDDSYHGYGYFGSTLCGITHDGLTASPYPWQPERPHACQDCEKAAAVIDERWPPEMRDRLRVHPTPPPGSDWPLF
jgi:hypothetical protein